MWIPKEDATKYSRVGYAVEAKADGLTKERSAFFLGTGNAKARSAKGFGEFFFPFNGDDCAGGHNPRKLSLWKV